MCIRDRDIVKQQIADEVKANVMKQALAENWAAPRAIPDLSLIHI